MNTDPKEDQLGENVGGDTGLDKGTLPTEHKKEDDERVHTVVPDNDSGIPGPPNEGDKADSAGEDSEASNKDGGPSKEDL
jgi:hypothetical protein